MLASSMQIESIRIGYVSLCHLAKSRNFQRLRRTLKRPPLIRICLLGSIEPHVYGGHACCEPTPTCFDRHSINSSCMRSGRIHTTRIFGFDESTFLQRKFLEIFLYNEGMSSVLSCDYVWSFVFELNQSKHVKSVFLLLNAVFALPKDSV